ncbi:hypothetical protein CCACVL1_29355 [Corchorus capsularis]|uniref:Uncharacterized protein n=1 Tax=Corchorus capsularis TaxID=210143 RepID=A0A1R3G200_COCAP|nr:hypothetical protein CCACVL1_29355 [Corchorus capsularis]
MGTNNLAGDIPSNIVSLLSKFVDVFLDETPSGLPPIKGIQHRIDFIPGAQIKEDSMMCLYDLSFPYVVRYKKDLRTNLLQGGGNDAPKAYHGLEDCYGEQRKDVQGLQGSMKMHGDIDNHVPSTKKMPFNPLKMPISPITRARAKRFKDALMGLVRTHLDDMKTIEVQLKSFDDDLSKKLPINYKDWGWLYLTKERFPEKRKSKLLPRGDDLSLFDNDADLKTNLLQGGGDDVPWTHHGLEVHNGDHGEDVHGLQGSKDKHEVDGDIVNHVSSTKKMLFDPLKMPSGPMTSARAKRFKDALMGLVRTHLDDMKTIEVHLKSFDDDLIKKGTIDFKLLTLIAIDV